MVTTNPNASTACKNLYNAIVTPTTNSSGSVNASFGFCGKQSTTAKYHTGTTYADTNTSANLEPFCACVIAAVPIATNFTATRNGSNYDLTWTSQASHTGYVIARNTSAVTFTPTNGQSYSEGTQGSDTIIYVGSATSFTDVGQADSNDRYYTIWAYDAATTYSPGNTTTGTTCPGTRTNGGCWLLGTSGASCDATCSAQGGVFNATDAAVVTSNTICDNIIIAIVGSSSSTGTSAGTNKMCTLNGTASRYFSSGSWLGTTYEVGYVPACACSGF